MTHTQDFTKSSINIYCSFPLTVSHLLRSTQKTYVIFFYCHLKITIDVFSRSQLLLTQYVTCFYANQWLLQAVKASSFKGSGFDLELGWNFICPKFPFMNQDSPSQVLAFNFRMWLMNTIVILCGGQCHCQSLWGNGTSL